MSDELLLCDTMKSDENPEFVAVDCLLPLRWSELSPAPCVLSTFLLPALVPLDVIDLLALGLSLFVDFFLPPFVFFLPLTCRVTQESSCFASAGLYYTSF